jgi:nicotinate-nucleotide--dimethylbenzimidazole phosphoribosyltransferase
MKLLLTGLRKLEITEEEAPHPVDGHKRLKVQYCAICRTDAKIWSEGHRDLILPRVPGHEITAMDANGQRFVVWPGKSCNKCRFCRTGRENLCEHMKILGFHHDGGFSHHVVASPESLVPIPDSLPSHMASFAEPVGCVFNALSHLKPGSGERMIIYGGGVLGLIAALAAQEEGAVPLIIEKNEEKIAKSAAFLKKAGISCVKENTESEFDMALNACADTAAFAQCLTKLRKGGRMSFFSGLTKNDSLETNLLNLMHYKETELYGAYGLTRENMASAVPFIARNMERFDRLIERKISPKETESVLPDILSGNCLKYILDFKSSEPVGRITGREPLRRDTMEPASPMQASPADSMANASAENKFDSVISGIKPVSDRLRPEALHKIDNKTKPLGSLGRLEQLALQASLIQESLNPRLHRKALFVFAGDHGITEEGVSAFPSEVTGQMVENFLQGGAAINVLCRHHHIDLYVVDMGVNADFEPHPSLFQKKIRKGTRNFALEEAMTAQEAEDALTAGMEVILHENAKNEIHIVGLGEMGIGNTTSASAIISVVTGITPEEATGRGTGLDDKAMEHKAEIIHNALQYHRPDPKNGMDILRKIGGYEIAGIAGAALAAASVGAMVVLDGVISTAGGLLAYVLNPRIKDYLVSGHRSVEIGQQAALSHMGIEPVIDFQMRLGEGTGAAMTINIVDAACRIMREMASFDDAGVAKRQQPGPANSP